MSRLFKHLSVRQRRFMEGCFYIGCFTPLAFTTLVLLIFGKAIYDRVTGKR